MNTRLCYYFGLILFVTSCAPRPVFRMKPVATNTTFSQGVEYVYRQKKGIKMTISYYRHMDKRFAMDVEITNNTDSVVRIDPATFSYDAYKYYRAPQPDSSAKIIASHKAIDPEYQLLKTDKAIARSIAHQKTSDLLYGIGQTANLASAITADTKHEREEAEHKSDEYAIRHDINQHKREFNRQGLRNRRKAWEIETIRKTDLFPNEYIRGYVFFKNDPDAFGYRFHINCMKTTFNIFFRQRKYSAK